MSAATYIYLYCVTQEPPQLERAGAVDAALYCLAGAGLYATVSDVPAHEFSAEQLENNFNDLAWLKHHVARHETVIEALMKATPVIPFKLATVFFNEANVQSFLEQYAGELTQKFMELRHKEEWGLKIYCAAEALQASLLLECDALRDLDQHIKAASPGKAYLLGKKKVEVLAVELEHGIGRYRAIFLERVEPLVCATKHLELQPRKATGRTDDMMLNAAFLVETATVARFAALVDELAAAFAAKGFAFSSTGPWPPYNFCHLTER